MNNTQTPLPDGEEYPEKVMSCTNKNNRWYDKNKVSDTFAFLTAVAFSFVVVFFCFGLSLGKRDIMKQAISEGAAKYTVNPTNGETKFEFIKP